MKTTEELTSEYLAWCELTGIPFKQYRLDLLLMKAACNE